MVVRPVVTRMVLAAIQTRAYGRLFRSRLEARWAVFFTTLRLRWEYEPEGFDLDGDFYLPDFRVWTPQGEPHWYEIKPWNVKTDAKQARFRKALDDDGYSSVRADLLSGDPKQCLKNSTICPRCGAILQDTKYEMMYNRTYSWQPLCNPASASVYCYDCDMETPSGRADAERTDGFRGSSYLLDKGWLTVQPAVTAVHEYITRKAVVAAMSARFEHGESPE